jgi:hypothetical protein
MSLANKIIKNKTKNMNIIILNSTDAMVYLREVTPDILEDIGSEGEDLLEYFCNDIGVSASDCTYMIGELGFDGLTSNLL